MSKIRTLPEVEDLIGFWKRYNRNVNHVDIPFGLTCGTFDILHAGHVEYLSQARNHCGRLVVALNTDESVRVYKSRPPVIPWEQRAAVLAGLEAVDYILPLEQDRPLPLIERLHPDLYVKGGDYTPGALRSAAAVEAYGGKVLIVSTPWKVSSTSIKNAIVRNALRVSVPPDTPSGS